MKDNRSTGRMRDDGFGRVSVDQLMSLPAPMETQP